MNLVGPLQRREDALRDQLRHLLSTGDNLDLVEGALLIAAEEYPLLDLESEKTRIRTICRNAALRTAPFTNPFAKIDALNRFLFEELGFRGNRNDYEDPRNSFLNDVLDRRLGIPISLSILYAEAAKACGIESFGVGLPGHFIVGLGFEDRTLYVDPFHLGAIVTVEDCRNLVNRATGRAGLFKPSQLAPTPHPLALQRMLLNLKRAHLARSEHDKALRCVERLRILNPDDLQELRDLGFLQAHLGRPGAAVAHLEHYLNQSPSAPDAASVRGRLAWLKRRLAEASGPS